MLNKIKKFFEDNDIDFDIRGNELIVPCPADLVPTNRFGEMSMDEIIDDEEVSVYTDEALIHLIEDEDGLSLLIELPDFSDEDEE